MPARCFTQPPPPSPACSGVLMVAIVWYTTHLSRKAISTALVSGGDEQVAEMATDPDVAELLRWAVTGSALPLPLGA